MWMQQGTHATAVREQGYAHFKRPFSVIASRAQCTRAHMGLPFGTDGVLGKGKGHAGRRC
jgi:hypothetical protein